MKVIIKESGFYAGTWYEASAQPVEIADAIARPFLPPYGMQMAKAAPAGAAPSDKQAASAASAAGAQSKAS